MSGPATKLTAFVARLPGIVPRVISAAVARTDKAWDGIGARLPTRGLPGEALLVAVVVGYAMVNVARSTLDKGIQKIHAVGRERRQRQLAPRRSRRHRHRLHDVERR